MYKIVLIRIKHKVCSKTLSPFSKLTKSKQVINGFNGVQKNLDSSPTKETCVVSLPCQGGHMLDKSQRDHTASKLFPSENSKGKC